MHEEPADERQRIGRVRLQAVRVHRQLARLRGMFHRPNPGSPTITPRSPLLFALWRRSLTALTMKWALCTSARGYCSTNWTPR